ncbi:MAG: PKD domain-containing protein [Gemmatimonadaceae bacterium]|nr:PKD domain-containing protein [Gemmatimonadaceae bacterium]
MLALTGLRSSLLILAAVMACAILPAVGEAAPYGEISSFGSAGVGEGQFSEESGVTTAFGVDATDNSVYVGDKPSNKVFRIQKFSEAGAFLGAARIEGSVPLEASIEGVAVDPVEKRFYVLLVQTRTAEGIDESVTAASTLYAFSTEPIEEAGKKVLPPVEGAPAGVLASKTVLKPTSNVPGQALLEPSGLTVDPKTHDVIIAGVEDPKGEEEPLTALQRVSKTGTLGPRWVDNAASPFFANEAATSPVVNSEGKVWIIGGNIAEGLEGGEEIDEIPANFAGRTKTFIGYQPGEIELVSFPGIPAPVLGGGLSLAPDGTLWAYAGILSPGEGKHPGALSFSTNGTPAVRGWTGGQTAKLGTGKCVVSFFGQPMVAAGASNRVFIFQSDSEAPRVIEFGEGGEGCPTAKAATGKAASGIEAFVGAVEEKETEIIPPGSEVKLTEAVEKANALKVKWSFGDGTSEALTTDQHQNPTILHKYTTEGEFKVKETIETDNLATPSIVLERTLTVSKPLPTAKFTASTPVTVGATDTFDAKGSTPTKGFALTEYKWSFGDGSAPVTTTTPSTTHAFAVAGHFTVTLQAIDSSKLVSKPFTLAITVNPVLTPPPPAQTTTTATTVKPPPAIVVLPFKIAVGSSSLTASKSGGVTLKINCAGPSACTGTATLKTAKALSAGRHKKKKVLTLATASFTLQGGHSQSLTLHLSAAARALLARSPGHSLSVRVVLLVRDSQGVAHPMQMLATIHAAKKHK